MTPRPDRYFTVMIVPGRGDGEVRQRVLSARRLQAAGAGAMLCVLSVLGLVGVAGWATPRALEHDRAVAENGVLRGELDEVEERLARMESIVARVSALDEQLRAAATAGVLPGMGPLPGEEAKAWEAWVDGADVPVRRPSVPEAHPEERARAVGERAEALERETNALVTLLPSLGDLLDGLNTQSQALPKIWPLHGTLTSPWGWRKFPFTGELSFHTGIDIGVPRLTPIFATADGVVERSDGDERRGRTVVIDHGSGVKTRYGHASILVASAGDRVLVGQLIAYSGNSGRSTGPHLHFDLYIDGTPVDPLEYLP